MGGLALCAFHGAFLTPLYLACSHNHSFNHSHKRTQCRHSFRVERWSDVGVDTVAAFASPDPMEVAQLRRAMYQCLDLTERPRVGTKGGLSLPGTSSSGSRQKKKHASSQSTPGRTGTATTDAFNDKLETRSTALSEMALRTPLSRGNSCRTLQTSSGIGGESHRRRRHRHAPIR